MRRVATWRSHRLVSPTLARGRRSRRTRLATSRSPARSCRAEATAVVLNVTATRSQGNGYVQVFPTGRAAVGSSSTLNLDFAGQTIPNAAFAPLGDGGRITVFTTFTTDVLIDVFGYFVPAATASAGRLVPLTPTRILDTRNNIGYTPPARRRRRLRHRSPRPGNPGDTKNCGTSRHRRRRRRGSTRTSRSTATWRGWTRDGNGIACESLPDGPIGRRRIDRWSDGHVAGRRSWQRPDVGCVGGRDERDGGIPHRSRFRAGRTDAGHARAPSPT